MDKKKRNIFLICFILSLCLDAANWVDIYKKGNILLKPDPTFGAKTDWYDIFYDNNKFLTVAPDGCVFVSNRVLDNLSKFSNDGSLIKTFSQNGRGPGDLDGPGEVSILDNKYLVVSETSESNWRTSIFDLNCKFVECVRIESFLDKAIALKDNKIAYIEKKYLNDGYETFNVKIVDFRTKEKVPIATFKREYKRTQFSWNHFEGQTHIAQINGGDLLVGYSEFPELTVYSPEGKKKYSFNLNIRPRKVTDEMKTFARKTFEKKLEKHPALKSLLKELDFSKMCKEYLPLYDRIIVDSDSNLLVEVNTSLPMKDTYDFQVYTPKGQYVCDSCFQFGEFIPSLGIPITFYKNTIYCILEKEEAEDSLFRIVKVSVQ